MWSVGDKRLDLRRALPSYVERACDVVYAPPFRIGCAELDVFALPADPRALQQLLDRELNAPVKANAVLGSQRGLRFTCRTSWVVFIYAAMSRMSSAHARDRTKGTLPSYELSLWVPVEKQREIGGTVVAERVWYLPYVVTDPVVAAITGREVYGFPKVPARLQKSELGGPPIAVAPDQRDARKTKERAGLFERQAERSADAGTPPELWGDIVARYMANLPVVFRKQGGPAVGEPTGAAGKTQLFSDYTALIEARVPITWLRGAHGSDAYFDFGRSQAEVRLAADLGLPARVRAPSLRLDGCTLELQRGQEIWLARDPIGWRPAAATVGGHTATTLGTQTRGIDIERGTAEVYLGQARAGAIARVLEAHFPVRLAGRPTIDPARDFVLFLFAWECARPGREPETQFQEFSIWLPVRHEEESAWYLSHMFRSPGATVVEAREVFGHPCQAGTFVSPTEVGDSHRVTALCPTQTRAGALEWAPGDGVVLSTTVRPATRRTNAAKLLTENFGVSARAQRLVSLMQVRHAADGLKACTQSVQTSYRTLRGPIDGEPLYRCVAAAPHLEVHDLLEDSVLEGRRLVPATLSYRRCHAFEKV